MIAAEIVGAGVSREGEVEVADREEQQQCLDRRPNGAGPVEVHGRFPMARRRAAAACAHPSRPR